MGVEVCDSVVEVLDFVCLVVWHSRVVFDEVVWWFERFVTIRWGSGLDVVFRFADSVNGGSGGVTGDLGRVVIVEDAGR